MGITTQYRVPGDHIIHRAIDGEVILVNLKSGTYYSTQRVGAELWQFLVEGMTPAQITKAIADHYGQPRKALAPSINAFVEELIEEGLLEAAQEAPLEPGADVTLSLTGAFEPPVLEVYDDMQDLLLVDPIHDVDENGWPHPQPQQEPVEQGAWWNPFQ